MFLTQQTRRLRAAALLLASASWSAGQIGIRVEGQKISVDSRTFRAEFNGATLASVTARRGGVEFCRTDDSVFPLELVYLNRDTLKQARHQQIAIKQLFDFAARVVVTGDDSDREMFLRLDQTTGDLCVTPGGRSARRGVLAVRWNIPFARDARLILPCVNGLLVESNRDFPRDDRFLWPYRWNAQLAVAERGEVSLMVHSEDTAVKFKALNLARKSGLTTLGFDSEQIGPAWDNAGAGGVEWRLNVYEGDWQTPASRYRSWMRRTYRLEEKRAHRPAWVDQISFSLQWANADVALLDALAKVYPPEKTLIHLSNWRTSKYDLDYPDYFPTAGTKAFLEKANAMGFKVMPHFNYFAVYLKHPVYQQVRDWQIRSVGRNEPEGWYWPPDTYDYTRMAYVHPGLGLWRRTLIDAALSATRALKAPAAFLDQTLCTWNTDNGIVENMSTVEGMRRLHEELTAIEPGLVLAGEGANEISIQLHSFAQGHIHGATWADLGPDHVPAAHSIGAFLWRGHTRLLGYYHLKPENSKDAEVGVEVYRRMGAIPTLICNDPRLITKDQPIVRKLIELADTR